MQFAFAAVFLFYEIFHWTRPFILCRFLGIERISSVVVSNKLCYTNESWNIFQYEFGYFYLAFVGRRRAICVYL